MLEILVALRRSEGSGAIGSSETTEKLVGDQLCESCRLVKWVPESINKSLT